MSEAVKENRVVPQDADPASGVWNDAIEVCVLGSVIDTPVCMEEWPVRSPQAPVEVEGVQQCVDIAVAIAIRRPKLRKSEES